LGKTTLSNNVWTKIYKGLQIPKEIIELIKQYASDIDPKAMQMAEWRIGNISEERLNIW